MDVKELRVLAKRTSVQPTVSSSCSHENDLISRQVAIDASCKDWCGCKYDDCPHNVKEYKYCDGCDTVVILENLPSAQSWIPCRERLPEEGQQIIATVADNDLVDVFIIRGYFKKMHKSVIAWMPLPEPYREEGDQE